MLKAIDNLPPGLVGVTASGEVVKSDYDNVLEPLLDRARSTGQPIRFLYHFASDFAGYSVSGALEDMRIGVRHLRLFERCAVVSDNEWIRKSSQLISTLAPCPLRVYGNADWAEAVAWLNAPPQSATLAHRLLTDRGVLVLEPQGPLRAEDFDAVALTVDPWLESEGALRGIVVHTKTIPGWENLGSMLRHLRFVKEHQRRVGRIALAANGKLAELGPRLLEHFVQAELKRFDHDDVDSAISWASAAPHPARSSLSDADPPRGSNHHPDGSL